MSADETKDINAAFDSIACAEEAIVAAAFQEGIAKGEREGKLEGYHYGYHKGCEVGARIGYYEGVVRTLITLREKGKANFPDKVWSLILKLKSGLDVFPEEPTTTEDYQELFDRLSNDFKRLRSLLKFEKIQREDSVEF